MKTWPNESSRGLTQPPAPPVSATAQRFMLPLLWVGAMLLGPVSAHGQEGAQPAAFDLPAPAFAGSPQDWLNTEGKALSLEKGRVYVVEFWTFGCINCQRNLPAYARWQKRFARNTFTLIGVHTPETAAEKKRENVLAQVTKLEITYPVLLDLGATNWNRWRQAVWPTVFLVDKRGHVRYRWLGELDWQHAGGEAKMASRIEQLLQER
jgi:thiol-disulfide isomerase/thioredoxin